MKAVMVLILVFYLLLALTPSTVSAQEPTPSPTPLAEHNVTLSSGDRLVIQRVVTYGDIAIVTSIWVGLVTLFLALVILLPKLWIRS
jgi:hypothetical protein